MNERIREIHRQVMLWSGKSDQIPEEYTKKFAEEILQDCMALILKESKWYWDKDEFESSNAIQRAAMRVHEHFGVVPSDWRTWS